MKPILLCLALLPTLVHADLVITEAMAQTSHSVSSADGDWWELTNTGASAVNLSGYKWDDTPNIASPTVSNFPNVTIQAGESIIIVEEPAANIAAWKAAWGLSTTQVVDRDQFTAMGGEGFSGLGAAGDEVNLYNPSGTLVAHVEFGSSITGRSFGFHRDGTPIYGLTSSIGKQGAFGSTLVPADTGSPGDARIHFNSAPVVYGKSTYSYPIVAVNPAGTAPVISAAALPSFLTLTAGAGGTATLSNNRALDLADAGNYFVQLTATSGASSTVQEFILTVLNPSPTVILNEYNAVSAANFLNGGTAVSDDDGGVLSTDSHFGRVAGNGGLWAEFVVVGNGGPGLLDLRGWKVEIGRNSGTGFTPVNTLVLSNHGNWQSVPSGTILTFTDRTTAQGGLNSGFAIRNRRSTVGDTWTNIWMGDPDYLTYTSFATNGYFLNAGLVTGISIDNSGTQFRVKNAAGQIIYGPAGEGVAPVTGTNSKEVLELENHPSPSVSPIVASSATAQGYSDGSSDSTFGSPNNWLAGATPTTQNFSPYEADGFQQWTEAWSLTGNAALRTADPDGDGRSNLQEYAFGGNPSLTDAAYPAGAISSGPVVQWSYVRRSDDPALVYSHQSTENLTTWLAATPVSTTSQPYVGATGYSTVTVQFNRPIPTPAKWFLRAKVE